MQFIVRKPWHVPERAHTPVEVFRNRQLHRRDFLRSLGVTAAGISFSGAIAGCDKPTDAEIEAAGAAPSLPVATAALYPAKRNKDFEYGRPETKQRDAAEYTNFYEFASGKDSWRYVGKFEPAPWKIEIGGLCAKPQTLDMDDIYSKFTLEERAYRHRCVERWAMCVPWTGFPLRELIELAQPKKSAKFVAFESFNRPKQAPGIAAAPDVYPWPYSEGLTIDEAVNEVAFIATGIYGEPLPKQHGAPIRLVIPWKYGFKSIKSIVKITLTNKRPATFWNTLAANEYGFEANVDPDVAHPRWSQRQEWMLGNHEFHDTQKYNGYGEFVGKLYSA